MSRSAKRPPANPANSPIPGMIADLLARIDPDGYREILAGFRHDYQPEDEHEERILARYADAAWRLRACAALEAEILREGAKSYPGDPNSQEAYLHAFLEGFEGPGLLSKLATYEDRLQNEFHTLTRLVTRAFSPRRRATKIRRPELSKLKPCTNVVQ